MIYTNKGNKEQHVPQLRVLYVRVPKVIQRYRECTYNVIFRRLHKTIVAVEK